MNLHLEFNSLESKSIPRVSGDEPPQQILALHYRMYSPRERG